jgi:hypothetical protein
MGAVSFFFLIPFLILGGIFILGMIILGQVVRGLRNVGSMAETPLQRDETGVFFMNGSSHTADSTPFDTTNAIDADSTVVNVEAYSAADTPVEASFSSCDTASSCSCDSGSSSCGGD